MNSILAFLEGTACICLGLGTLLVYLGRKTK